MKKNEFILRKIPLESFIQMLINAYDDGADFFDLVGEQDDKQDSIGICIRESYFETSIPEQGDIVLTEEYINLLLT